MMLRTWIKIIIFLVSIYGAWGILNDAPPSFKENEFVFILYAGSPWILLFGSTKAWHQCFVWRRMLSARHKPPVLSRGQYHAPETLARPHLLEHVCMALFFMAFAAILKQFSLTHIQWWIGSIIGAYFTLRFVIKRIA